MVDTNVNGHSKIYGVIGTPINHSLSPIIYNTLGKMLGHNFVYVPFLVEQACLKDAINGALALNIQGLNVTIPHKQTVIEFLAGVDDSAAKVGAVNTLKLTPEGYIGYNTDYIGIREVFATRGVSLQDKDVVIIGAGGSACAAAVMAAQSKVRKLYIVNRTAGNALNIKKHVRTYYDIDIETMTYEDIHRINQYHTVIQTTSVGFGNMEGVSPITDPNFYAKGEIALDIIYKPWKTKLLEEAQQAGLDCINGFEMLIFQALAAYGIWHDVEFDNDFKLSFLKKIMEQQRG